MKVFMEWLYKRSIPSHEEITIRLKALRLNPPAMGPQSKDIGESPCNFVLVD
jgi:hypothetical protein